MTNIIVEEMRNVGPVPLSLARGLTAAIQRGDIRLAVQLAGRLIFQPDCPVPMQTHAILVHSALSLRLGARRELIENNLRATISRLAGGTELLRLTHRGHMAPWKLDLLSQLHSALRSLRLRGEIPFSVQRPPVQTPHRRRPAIPEQFRAVNNTEKLEVVHEPESVDMEIAGEDVGAKIAE